MKNITILILNGPNLNLLGSRQTNIYGNTTLEKILKKLFKIAKKYNITIKHLQSNAEHIIIEKIHKSKKYDYIIINPGALSHTSISLRDALLSINTPFIEIHISNIFSRETFRHHSWLSDISQGIIAGLGEYGYYYALQTIIKRLKIKKI